MKRAMKSHFLTDTNMTLECIKNEKMKSEITIKYTTHYDD